MSYKIFLFFLFISIQILPQEADIVNYLKEIESGNKDKVASEIPQLKRKFPADPSIKFLEGILKEDGEQAVNIFNEIVTKYSTSKYADAAQYRVFSYYFALGDYKTARENLNKLKSKYPNSPYIKIAEREIPAKHEEKQIVKKPEEKEETPVEEKKEKIYKFTIQAGAFSNAANAAALKKDFHDSGFYTELKEKNVGGTIFNVVYVGRFETEDEARNFLQVINREYKLDGRVITIN